MFGEITQSQVSTGFDAAAMTQALRKLEQQSISSMDKGVRADTGSLTIGDRGKERRSVVAGELPVPVAIVRQSALDSNAEWMKRMLQRFDLLLAPHAKTSMSPHLFAHQALNGAWGLTVATVQQASVAAAFGCRKILIANQVTGSPQLLSLRSLVIQTPNLVAYVCIDSVQGLRDLKEHLSQQLATGAIRLLLEVGFEGGRTGCRTLQDACVIFDECARSGILMAGVSGYEGLITTGPGPEDAAAVDRYFDTFEATAKRASELGVICREGAVVSAGGSSYFDIVGRRLSALNLGIPFERVLRSGCYVTHDCGSYELHQNQLLSRAPDLVEELGWLKPALFVCGLVQSLPEPGLCLITMGKRDVGHDVDLPKPLWWSRPGATIAPTLVSEGCYVSRLNDQHAYLRVPPSSDLQIGDLVCFGISHPCTTFDRWRVIHMVDDDWVSVGLLPTFF